MRWHPGTFGPMLAAMVAARVEGSGIRALFRPLGLWRVNARWYLAALAIPAATFVIAASAYNLAGHTEPLLYPPDRPGTILGAAVFAFGEEVGWRGFALPRLRDRYGMLVASAMVGVLWGLWLIPLLVLQGTSADLYAVLVPGMVGCSMMFAWIFQHTRGSLLLAILMYIGVHLNNPGHLLPNRSAPFVIQMVATTSFSASVSRCSFPERLARRKALGPSLDRSKGRAGQGALHSRVPVAR